MKLVTLFWIIVIFYSLIEDCRGNVPCGGGYCLTGYFCCGSKCCSISAIVGYSIGGVVGLVFVVGVIVLCVLNCVGLGNVTVKPSETKSTYSTVSSNQPSYGQDATVPAVPIGQPLYGQDGTVSAVSSKQPSYGQGEEHFIVN